MKNFHHQQNSPSSRLPAAGFTLIELLVVIFIMSIVTTVTLMTIGRNENRDIETFANELTQMVSLAEEQALLEPAVLGIAIQSHGIEFKTLTKNQETQKSAWEPLADHVLQRYAIPANMQLTLQVSGNQIDLSNNQKSAPPIIISSNGGMTPFILYVGKAGKKPRFAVTADADGNVFSTALS